MTERPWERILQGEQMTPDDDRRFARYTRDLVHGLETIKQFPQGVTIFGSARFHPTNKYYQAAYELGAKLAQHNHTVTTGGGPGIMEAANRGAYEYGGRSIGLNIKLSHEQEPNAYLTDTLEFEYFFARKVMLAMSAKVYVMFPGGFGTMDELTEIIILMQEHKMPKMPVYLFGKSFWRGLDRFYRGKMLSLGLINKRDLSIYHITDDIHEIVKAANKIGHPKVKTNYYDGFHAAE